MYKKIWIIANWKANKTVAEALDWISKVGPKVPWNEKIRVVVCPSFTALAEVKKAIITSNFPLLVGAQDLSAFGQGAYTGEEPADLLHDFCNLAILGHSERRKNFAETDEMIAEKVKQARENNIIPVVCVQDTETAVPEGTQLVAYEPVWAIGSGKPDSPENANTQAGQLKDRYGKNLSILYGGSIISNNVKSFIIEENISGVLVGSASLSSGEFIKICKNCVL